MNQVVTNSGAAAQYYDVAKTMQNKKAAKAENTAAPAKKSFRLRYLCKKNGTPLFWVIRTFALLFLISGRSLRKSRTRIFISYAPFTGRRFQRKIP